MTKGVSEGCVVQKEAGRLDKWLAEAFPLYSRTYFQYLIERGCVLVNGLQTKKRMHLDIGDEVDVCFEFPPESSLQPEELPLSILYEDEHIIAIDKQAGLVVHPAAGHPHGTLVNALLYHCRSLPGEQTFRPGIVHRLDKDTSGVLIAAKTTAAHQKLISMFANRCISKKYIAICVGNPGTRDIDAPIGRNKSKRQQMAATIDGKAALSRCRTLAYNETLSLVEIDLVTGRTHQIRVHMQLIHTPVLGDAVYGSPAANRKFAAKRQLLHAHQIDLAHPMTGKSLHFVAPLPQDMITLCNNPACPLPWPKV